MFSLPIGITIPKPDPKQDPKPVRTWYCSECGHGPMRLDIDTHCANCHKRRSNSAHIETLARGEQTIAGSEASSLSTYHHRNYEEPMLSEDSSIFSSALPLNYDEWYDVAFDKYNTTGASIPSAIGVTDGLKPLMH